MNLMQKGFVQFIILGVVVLAIVAAGAFYLGKQVSTPKPQSQTSTTQPTISQPSPSPTPDETANWKTYTNNDGKYSIKYPIDFSLHINEIHVGDANEYQSAKDIVELDSPSAGVIPFILISHKQIAENMSLASYIDQSTGCGEIKGSDGNAITIDGRDAKLYENTRCGRAGSTTEAYVKNGTIFYQIVFQDAGNLDKRFVTNFLTLVKFLK